LRTIAHEPLTLAVQLSPLVRWHVRRGRGHRAALRTAKPAVPRRNLDKVTLDCFAATAISIPSYGYFSPTARQLDLIQLAPSAPRWGVEFEKPGRCSSHDAAPWRGA
jgi:hypothetical protein